MKDIYRQKVGRIKEVRNKRKDYFRQGQFSLGVCQVDFLTSAGQKFLDCLIEITFLAEAETALSLDIKSLFSDLELFTDNSFFF